MSKINLMIVMATKNGEKFIAEQLKSFDELEVSEFSLVVLDSYSQDGTVGILEDWSDALNIRIIKENLKSVSESFCALLANCPEGWFVAFSDQDDIWYRTKISQLLKLGYSDEPTLYCSARDYIDEHGQFLGKRSKNLKASDFSMANALVENLVYGNTILLNPPGVKLAKQYLSSKNTHWDWFLYLVFSFMGQIRYLDEPTIGYRLHNSNLVGIGRRKRVLKVFSEIKFKHRQAEKFFYQLEETDDCSIYLKFLRHFEIIRCANFSKIISYLFHPLFKRTSQSDQLLIKYFFFFIWLENRFLSSKGNPRNHY